MLMLNADPVFQEFHGRGVAERGMLPSPVVERLDIVEQVDIRCSPRTVAEVMPPLILQIVEETLRRRVVPAIAFAAHRADQHVLLQPRLKAWLACWLPRVGVMDQAGGGFLRNYPMVQCIDNDVRRHSQLDRPADDFPIEQTKDPAR